MKITRVALERFAAPPAGPTTPARESVWLTLEDERGHRGVGEASPLPGYSFENFAESVACLDAATRAPLALDAAADPLAQAAGVLENFTAPPSARFALETALLDLFAQRAARPLWALLARERATAPVPLATLLPDGDVAAQIAAAERALSRGIETLKLKVGREAIDADVARVTAIAAACGVSRRGAPANKYGNAAAGGSQRVRIRLDANQRWSAAEAKRALGALADLTIEFVEEPCPALALDALPLPVAIDESWRQAPDWRHLEALFAHRVCTVAILKPMVLGGALGCLALARKVAAWGGRAVVTHTFDGPVAMAAAAALALALDPPPLACGLDRHAALAMWPAVRWAGFAENAIVPWAAPGLGLA